MNQNPTTLIAIITHQLERSLPTLLASIPNEVLGDPDIHLLILDDASTDQSHRQAIRWAQTKPTDKVTTLRNRRPLGDGGCQKLIARFAIEARFQLLIVHDPSTYFETRMTAAFQQQQQQGADLILAASPGRPSLPQRVFTAWFNRLTRLQLSDTRAGSRAYSTQLLRRLSYESHPNGALFNTALLLHACKVGARIAELPAPRPLPRAHPQPRRHPGAISNTLETARFVLAQRGLADPSRYRDFSPPTPTPKALTPTQTQAFKVVLTKRPETILDLGCGSGDFARATRELGAEVTGLDRRVPLNASVDRFHRCNLEAPQLPVDAFRAHMVVMLNVLEQLHNPERFLIKLRNQSQALNTQTRGSLLVLAVPNTASLTRRLALLFGRFHDNDRGPLNAAPQRRFTRQSLLELLERCGYDVDSVKGIGARHNPLSQFLARLWPTLFATQLLIVARPRAGVQKLHNAFALRHQDSGHAVAVWTAEA